MVIVAGFVQVQPAALAGLLAPMRALEAQTRTEDGNLYYAIAVDDEASGHLTFLEKWRDEAALKVHLATQPVKDFLALLTPLATAADLKLYDATGERPLPSANS